MPTAPHPRPRRPHAGFTLVEMMVVIGLIVVLISILVPAISHVRKTAYDTKTKAILSKISSACHAYYLDWHAYPGPLSNSQVLPGAAPVSNDQQITSSENLVLGLVGGLIPNGGGGTFNAADVTNTKGPTSLNPSNPKRYQSYINVEPGELSTGVISAGKDSDIPEFMDGWPSEQQRPVLYSRASVGAQAVIDDQSDPLAAAGQRPQYRYEEFLPYAQPAVAKGPGYWLSWFDMYRNPNMSQVDASGRGVQGAPEAPRGKDSFILAAQGMSRDWGRTDVVFSGD